MVYALYTTTVRTYTVTFYNGTTLLGTVNNIPYGSDAVYTGSTPVSPDGTDIYQFDGWEPSPTNIQGNTKCIAQFSSLIEDVEIADSWDEILAAVADGTYATKYKLGNYKPLDLGPEGIINMQIAAKDKDRLYGSSGEVALTWISKELLKDTIYMSDRNSVVSWPNTNVYNYLNTSILQLIPENVRGAIKQVLKSSGKYSLGSSTSHETNTNGAKIWIPSYPEVFLSKGHYHSFFSIVGPRKFLITTTINDDMEESELDAKATIWWLRDRCSSSYNEASFL